jgi:hypothetical protein
VTDLYRTTLVDECLHFCAHSARSVVLYYFYQPEERTAKAFFASILKQLLSILIDTGVPCPATIRDEIKHAFGLENRQPDLGSLVADIVMPLLATFKEVTVILDGPDLCDEQEQRDIWKHLRKIVESGEHGNIVKVAVGSRDHTNVNEHLPDISRLRMDDGHTKEDIDLFIDEQVNSHSGSGQLFGDSSLRVEVQRLLKNKANGM